MHDEHVQIENPLMSIYRYTYQLLNTTKSSKKKMESNAIYDVQNVI